MVYFDLRLTWIFEAAFKWDIIVKVLSRVFAKVKVGYYIFALAVNGTYI